MKGKANASGGRSEDMGNVWERRKVNNLLHTLRGEQFRHSQNVSGSKIRLLNESGYNKPSLPLSQIFGGTGSDATDAQDMAAVQPAPFRAPGQPGHRPRPLVTLIEGVPTYAYPDGAVPGPKPPKSWSALFDPRDERTGQEWRQSALSLFFSQLPLASDTASHDSESAIPTLASMCLRVLLRMCSSAEELAGHAQYVSPHLRRELMRWCAVHQPLSSAKLHALCADEGHADGELVVVGPEAGLRFDHLRRLKGKNWTRPGPSALADEEEEWEDSEADGGDESPGILEEECDWDKSSPDIPPPLVSLVLFKTNLSVPSILPPTLTHLALLALPRPTHVHHLPAICPLIQVLDLSFNGWLAEPSSEGTLDRVEWRRWRSLRVLGLKECGITTQKIAKVNEGRWTDVEIIGLEV
ncbi:hypothetical protein BC835DRAFT_226793 [Cytidiella melzeri]|nr:hypothetical protein BC835DRAFT_226793 [Cytidiella melzeri]